MECTKFLLVYPYIFVKYCGLKIWVYPYIIKTVKEIKQTEVRTMNTIQANDYEKRLDMAFELLCLAAYKFNKNFLHNEHIKYANQYSLDKLERAYIVLKQA